MRNNRAMHTIAVLALDRVMPFELGIPGRVFGSAHGVDGAPLYRLVTCSLDGGPVRTSLDFSIAVEHGPEVLAEADTIVIPPQANADFDADVSDALLAALARVRPGARMVSICTAAGLFAATGLLDGRPATTHWAFADRFAARFPQVALDPEVLFVDDGDLLTSAGAASGIDLCLHIVRRDHGSEVANRAARACIVPPFRDGGQAQYVQRPVPPPLTTSTAGAREWALGRLSQTLTLAQLADHAGMSVRTFTRRFREEVGVSPNRWLVRQRIERARELLERSDLGVDAIAAEAGFGSAAALRQQFQRTVGVAPSAYRRSFRATAAA